MKNSLLLAFVFHLSIVSLSADGVVHGYTNYDIQEAIDIEAARGGGTVECPSGEYELRNAIYLKNNVILKGQGESTVFKKCPRFTTRVIKDISEGDYWVYVDDVASFKCGDGITVFSESLKPALAWVTEIVEIVPGALRLKRAASHNVYLSSVPFIFCSFPCVYCLNVENVSIYDLTIDGNRKENPTIDSWWDSCIGCTGSRTVEITNVRVIEAPGDGVSLNGADHVRITNTEINNSARLGVHVGGGCKYTYIGNSKIWNSGLSGVINVDGLYLCYGAAFGLYENNVIMGNRGAGLSIGRWDSGNIFFNNIVSDNGIGLLFREDSFETGNIVFLQNQILNNHAEDLLMVKPVFNIFMDVWPAKRSIHPESSFLYCMDLVKKFKSPQNASENTNAWVRFK